MSIRKEKNNTYTILFSKKDIFTNKTIRTSKRGFKSLKEAKEYEKKMLTVSTDITFRFLYEQYNKTRDVIESTNYEKNVVVNKYLQELLNKKYTDITKPYLLNYVNNIDAPIPTKNKLIVIIKSICQYANDVFDLPDNSKVLKKHKVAKKEFSVWTIEQYYIFENKLKELYPKYVSYFHTLFFTGMRKGEARALTVDDLTDDKFVIINKSLRRGLKSLKTPKTQKSNRKVKLDDKTFELLKQQKAISEKWLFGSYRPYCENTLNHIFNIVIEKAELPKIRIHDLRHSHATYLINNGINIVAVSKRLGHSNINTTLSTYTHLLEKTDNELIDLLNSNFY